MRLRLLPAAVLLALAAMPAGASAAVPMTLRYNHHLFPVTLQDIRSWQSQDVTWTFRGLPFDAPKTATLPDEVPQGLRRDVVDGWDRAAIIGMLETRVAPMLSHEPGAVIIRTSSTGAAVFEGVGLPGRRLQTVTAADVIIEALAANATDVLLPVEEIAPAITVEDPELAGAGIRELVALGESDFTGSPPNRVHNIGVGLRRFSGHRIPRGETFSFVKALGPVNAATGYRKELTILGERTLPDYGGGLCQVSTTAYRGVWQAGFPIDQRHNHSYTVRYYAPQGTDATIYPPSTDMKFVNDGPGDLLIQTWTDAGKAYFLFYGTKDDRTTVTLGPYTWGRQEPPPPRTEYTTEIPPGTKRKVGEATPGLHALWVRTVERGGERAMEHVYSSYEARPLFHQIGAENGDATIPPDWINIDPAG